MELGAVGLHQATEVRLGRSALGSRSHLNEVDPRNRSNSSEVASQTAARPLERERALYVA
jgi:hypothetical protein